MLLTVKFFFAMAERYAADSEQSFLPSTETVNYVGSASTNLPYLATRDGNSAGVKNLSYNRKRKGEATSEANVHVRCFPCNEVGHSMFQCPDRAAFQKFREAKLQIDGVRSNDKVLGTNVSNLISRSSFLGVSELSSLSDRETIERDGTIEEEDGIGEGTVVGDLHEIFADGKIYRNLLPQGEVSDYFLEDGGHWESRSDADECRSEDTLGTLGLEDGDVRQCTSEEVILLGNTESGGTRSVGDDEAVLDSGASAHVFKRKISLWWRTS